MKTILIKKRKPFYLFFLIGVLSILIGCTTKDKEIAQLEKAIQQAQTTADAAYQLAEEANSKSQQAVMDAFVAENIAIKTQNATDDALSSIQNIEDNCCENTPIKSD